MLSYLNQWNILYVGLPQNMYLVKELYLNIIKNELIVEWKHFKNIL